MVLRYAIISGLLGLAACSTTSGENVAVRPAALTVQLEVGTQRSCAVLDDASVSCWGRNQHGELGDGSTVDRLAPVDIKSLPGPVTAISVGFSHTCALIDDGQVACWGRNVRGELGDGTTTDRTLPVVVTGLRGKAQQIDVDGLRTCAALDDGTVTCWGHNWSGELGDGSTADRSQPVDVKVLPGSIASVSVGFNHTCVLTDDGQVACWGYNEYGGLGDGSTLDRTRPVVVEGLPGPVTAVSVGDGHTCALIDDGQVACWGYNEYGGLGDGSTLDRTRPVVVEGLPGSVTAVSAGDGHTCAMVTTGAPYCWGYNEYGGLGDGTKTNRLTPTLLTR